MVRVFGLGEGGVAVFLREQAGVVVGDLDGEVFEEGVAKGEEVLDLGVWVSGVSWDGGGECGEGRGGECEDGLFLRAGLWSTLCPFCSRAAARQLCQ